MPAGNASIPRESRPRSLGGQALGSWGWRALRSLVWRRVPRAMRQAVLRVAVGGGRAPLAQGAAAAQPVCVIGLLSTPTGIGEGGRLAARALAALGHEVLSVDVSDLMTGRAPAAQLAPPLEIGPGTAILHFNPDNLPAILSLLGRERLRGKRIVGYWAWELPRIPEAWILALDEVDEVWTPSRFVAAAVRPFTAKPVRVVPHPTALGPAGRARRAEFGIGAEFTVLTMFSFGSFARKNPVAALGAFRRAFGDAPDRRLILKSVGGAQAPAQMRALRRAVDGAANVAIDDRVLGERERLDLIASADVLLSLHRAEGFGLVLAEAMLAGVPVVATGWSGHDFIDDATALTVPFRLVAADPRDANGRGIWAEPDVAAAATHLAALAAEPGRFAVLRGAARERARRRRGRRAFGRALEAAGLAAPGHSCRSASIGFKEAARRAGK